MIEMEYTTEQTEAKVLMKGDYEDYKYVIVSRGLYPECYIQLPFKHMLCRRNEMYINSKIQLHGDISYYGVNNNGQIPCLDIGRRILGWSYSQLGDYVGYYKKCGYSTDMPMKQWTTKEIVKDVKEAIKQMKGIQYE